MQTEDATTKEKGRKRNAALKILKRAGKGIGVAMAGVVAVLATVAGALAIIECLEDRNEARQNNPQQAPARSNTSSMPMSAAAAAPTPHSANGFIGLKNSHSTVKSTQRTGNGLQNSGGASSQEVVDPKLMAEMVAACNREFTKCK